MSEVILKCVKEGSKLRVRIVTEGYYNQANCQFPRELREDGRSFSVDASAIKLITTRNRYYYCIRNKQDIKVIHDMELIRRLKVYENKEQEDCLICFEAQKQTVFIPCGHYYTCHACSNKCTTCPICRVNITHRIDKKSME